MEVLDFDGAFTPRPPAPLPSEAPSTEWEKVILSSLFLTEADNGLMMDALLPNADWITCTPGDEGSCTSYEDWARRAFALET